MFVTVAQFFQIESDLIYPNSEKTESALSDTKLVGTYFSQCMSPFNPETLLSDSNTEI